MMPEFKKTPAKAQKLPSKEEHLEKESIDAPISAAGEFKLEDPQTGDLYYPCHLGILFCGKFEASLFKFLERHLRDIFNGVFYEIHNLGEYTFSEELLAKGIKEEYKNSPNGEEKLEVHPTNKLYQILIDSRITQRINMILLITDLPIYSSENQDIVFLFGEANLKHHTGIVSTLKLKESFYGRAENKELFSQRLLKEVIHEIGHLVLQAEHCNNNWCVMRFSDSLEGIDHKGVFLCKECSKSLERLKEEFNFS